ncbi:E3 ubiquitin-protein ligase RHF2A isoform X1 [Argentina anserina]|uniref:E3 ubiquitin-protein ligase RHF2A isoform X1 n=1 Tax=Argentina anserina TaxID=57926 RepID=UPI0021761EEF|nr:E3 ubiquitin-protein ligase RHF2A isoform X1 [Potentilla anserina]XP_050371055.1 E3 ubiquitin-protein ligase RHF2A isoform X2 [Potentilla anserina]XP_050371056.1 E3 ubiquitin-protein ligase RHF2A isoform X3 [Potentilla anserina]XP_050371057.1 E3 ubiquitin-protein ligase RHF2A isoform X4 [Potentilla anserina]XP_050371058.1 E3 ubiquitin-protein ligase RHF2A isoform X2 [Potentilla anserina]XP_050371059.1 E3 ubiquitin-protein ligase RHF2A isoform X5 [Potentilla anserina]XP_050371060.1 E3 ubiqu
MEVPPGMEESGKSEANLTSAAAFVEGGIQEACDDACSICLEAFCDSDPSTLTGCKHEFHLQCILEWCQRSSQCPMCWQPISLKDPTSQELFEGVERERSVRSNPPRSTAIFHHPTLGDFELQHLPVGVNDAELEERIIQHLAAAAAMGRARHIARREGQRNRSSGQGRPQFLVFSTHPPATASSSPDQMREGEQAPSNAVTSPSPPMNAGEVTSRVTTSRPSQSGHVSASASGSSVPLNNQHGSSLTTRRSPSQSSPSSQDRAGPSDLQSFSENLKARFNAVSMKYKESISKSTRGWKERLFSRNSSVSDVGPEVRREVDDGIATVSRMMEHLETRENNRFNGASGSDSVNSSVSESENRRIAENGGQNSLSEQNMQATCAAGSSSN